MKEQERNLQCKVLPPNKDHIQSEKFVNRRTPNQMVKMQELIRPLAVILLRTRLTDKGGSLHTLTD